MWIILLGLGCFVAFIFSVAFWIYCGVKAMKVEKVAKTLLKETNPDINLLNETIGQLEPAYGRASEGQKELVKKLRAKREKLEEGEGDRVDK